MSTDLISTALWRTPVLVRIGFGASEPVQSPSDALNYLTRRWPAERGEHHEIALRKCHQAADGLLPAEIAREAFVAAAIEAYVHA